MSDGRKDLGIDDKKQDYPENKSSHRLILRLPLMRKILKIPFTGEICSKIRQESKNTLEIKNILGPFLKLKITT